MEVSANICNMIEQSIAEVNKSENILQENESSNITGNVITIHCMNKFQAILFNKIIILTFKICELNQAYVHNNEMHLIS